MLLALLLVGCCGSRLFVPTWTVFEPCTTPRHCLATGLLLRCICMSASRRPMPSSMPREHATSPMHRHLQLNDVGSMLPLSANQASASCTSTLPALPMHRHLRFNDVGSMLPLSANQANASCTSTLPCQSIAICGSMNTMRALCQGRALRSERARLTLSLHWSEQMSSVRRHSKVGVPRRLIIPPDEPDGRGIVRGHVRAQNNANYLMSSD